MDPRSSRFAVLILDPEERPKAGPVGRKKAAGKGRPRERAGYVVAFEASSPTPLVAWRLQKVRRKGARTSHRGRVRFLFFLVYQARNSAGGLEHGRSPGRESPVRLAWVV